MQCPNCQKGNIRVTAGWYIGHRRPLVCDNCFSVFVTDDCTAYDTTKLSPESTLSFTGKVISDEDRARAKDSTSFQSMPLVEDFKKSSA